MTRDTSIEAYYIIKEKGLLNKIKWEVYDFIHNHKPCTQRDAVTALGKDKGSTNGTYSSRFAELKRLGVVREVGKTKCPHSNMMVYLWETTNDLPQKFERPLSKEKQIKELTEDCIALAAELVSVQEELNILKSRDADKT